jgi:hypothetical protein
VGAVDTYDICQRCGEAIVDVGNTSNYVHVEKDGVKNGIPATDCKLPHVRQVATTTQGQSIATHARAAKPTGRRG